MYYFYRKSNRGMEFVCCMEVVRLSESPLLEVSLYVYKHGCLVLFTLIMHSEASA